MKEYYKISTTDESQLNRLLEKGWEVIETSKSKGEYDEYITYHIGFPLTKAFENAMKILKSYEKYNLRIELLEKIAEDAGEDISNYSTLKGRRENNALVEMLELTDFIISGVDFPKYYKQKQQEDSENLGEWF